MSQPSLIWPVICGSNGYRMLLESKWHFKIKAYLAGTPDRTFSLEFSCSICFYLFQTFIIKLFKHTAKWKEFYSKPLYTYLLGSTVNILLYLFYHISVYASSHVYVFLILLDAFQSESPSWSWTSTLILLLLYFMHRFRLLMLIVI